MTPLCGHLPQGLNTDIQDLFHAVAQHIFSAGIECYNPALEIGGNDHVRGVGDDVFQVFLVTTHLFF